MSFFAFQDIISCTTGIMVLITLMLTMELMTKTINADQTPTVSADPTEVENALAEATARAQELRGEVEKGTTMLAKIAGGEMITATQMKAVEDAVKNLKKDEKSITGKLATTNDENNKLITDIKNLEELIKILQGKIKAWAEDIAKHKKKTIITVLGGDQETRRVLFVESYVDKCIVAEIPRNGPNKGIAQEVKRFTGPDPYKAFISWAVTSLAPNKDCFVLLIRPKAVKQWNIMVQGLKGRRFDVGWDVWPLDKNLFGEE
jgi:hypothetical protein